MSWLLILIQQSGQARLLFISQIVLVHWEQVGTGQARFSPQSWLEPDSYLAATIVLVSLMAQQFHGGAASHQNDKSSKRQVIECPSIDKLIEKIYSSKLIKKGDKSSNTLLYYKLIESTINNRAYQDLSKTGLRSSLAAVEPEIHVHLI